eukprot:871959-Alexandrium_andersonii.AAC.1
MAVPAGKSFVPPRRRRGYLVQSYTRESSASGSIATAGPPSGTSGCTTLAPRGATPATSECATSGPPESTVPARRAVRFPQTPRAD